MLPICAPRLLLQTKDGIKGSYWLLDMDLKDGNALKHDKTGKAILTILRHLGRVQEVRAGGDGVHSGRWRDRLGAQAAAAAAPHACKEVKRLGPVLGCMAARACVAAV